MLVHGLALSAWSVFLDEGLQYVLVKQLEGFIAREVGAVFDDRPIVSISEELAAEATAGGDGGVDLLPEGLKVIWWAEWEREACVDEVRFGDFESLEVRVADLDSVVGKRGLDFGSCFGSCDAVAAAVLCPHGPSGVEEWDGVAAVAASEVYGLEGICGIDFSEELNRFEDGVAWWFALHAIEIARPISAVRGFVDWWGGGIRHALCSFS
jgi:hypothetical protein